MRTGLSPMIKRNPRVADVANAPDAVAAAHVVNAECPLDNVNALTIVVRVKGRAVNSVK